MIWTVKRIRSESDTLAEISFTAGTYKQAGYATLDLIVRLADAGKYPLGSQFTTSELVAA